MPGQPRPRRAAAWIYDDTLRPLFVRRSSAVRPSFVRRPSVAHPSSVVLRRRPSPSSRGLPTRGRPATQLRGAGSACWCGIMAIKRFRIMAMTHERRRGAVARSDGGDPDRSASKVRGAGRHSLAQPWPRRRRHSPKGELPVGPVCASLGASTCVKEVVAGDAPATVETHQAAARLAVHSWLACLERGLLDQEVRAAAFAALNWQVLGDGAVWCLRPEGRGPRGDAPRGPGRWALHVDAPFQDQ